jgi:CheY-like chemotaxis protein
LVVDDDPDIRQTLTEILVDEGYAACTAGDGIEALSILRSDRPTALVVLDLTMPVMDGHQFLAEQRRDVALAGIPVVVITAGVKRRSEDLGVAAVIAKPFSVAELLSKIEACLAPAGVARDH